MKTATFARDSKAGILERGNVCVCGAIFRKMVLYEENIHEDAQVSQSIQKLGNAVLEIFHALSFFSWVEIYLDILT